jgi:anti-anti-sigma factor
MPTEIIQTDAPDADVTILRVSGEMMEVDAAVIAQVASSLREETGRRIVVDLADLDFLDSEAAPALRRLGEREGITIEGVEVFLQSSIDQAEGRST